MAFRPEFSWEFNSIDEIETRTIRALRNHVSHVQECSHYYAETLAGVEAQDINSLDDFAQLPLTTKQTVADKTESFTTAAEEKIVETVVTSGSTGKPLLFPMTANDLDRLAFNEALSFDAAGVTPADRAQILVSLDRLFIAGMAYYRGLTLLGANTTRIGVLPFAMQKHYIELLKPTVLVGVPSFLLKLGRELKKLGYDPGKGTVRKLVCIGESLRTAEMQFNGVGTALEELFDARAYSTYGITELSIAYCECMAQNGGHAHPELVYTEIVDDAGNPVPDGEPGELVATTLGVEALPLVRYRTGDITFKVTGTCSCGRNSCRLGPVLARKSQMIKLKGTTIYPTTITNALDELPQVEDYVIVLEGDASLSDQVSLHAVTRPDKVPLIAEHLRTRARVSIPVLVSNAPTINSLRGDNRKKVRIIDKRSGARK